MNRLGQDGRTDRTPVLIEVVAIRTRHRSHVDRPVLPRPIGGHGRARVAREPAVAYDTAAVSVAAGAGRDDGRLGWLVAQLADELGVDDDAVASLPDQALRDRVRTLARLEGLAAAGMAATVRAVRRSDIVATDGASSLTGWLAEQTGRTRRQACRLEQRATVLPELPGTSAGLADGTVGVAAADAIIDAARDTRLGPPDEVDRMLVPVAAAEPVDHLRRHVRTRIQQADRTALLADEGRQQQLRRASLSRRGDGMWDLSGLLPAETGERLRTLLGVFDVPDPAGTPDDRRRTPAQRLADALDTAVSVALDHADLPTEGGLSRPHLSVLVDLATLTADLTDPNDPDRPIAPDHPAWAQLPPAETAWGGLLSPQAARRLCCDASLTRVVTADSQVLDVGRQTRVWTAPQRRAIHARDRSCRGCARPIGWTEIHHIRWWRNGGRTDLDNGLALCHHCHRLIHDHGWHVTLDPATAAVTWTSPDRRRTRVTHPRPPC